MPIFLPHAAVAGDSCGASPEIKVTMTPVFANTVYDFSYGVPAIQLIANDVVHQVREGWALGLTSYEPVLEITAPVSVEPMPDGNFCARPQRVDITVGFRDVTMYIPRELSGDSCGFDEILKHETKHLAVDRRVLEKYAPLVEARIRDYLRLNGAAQDITAESASRLQHNMMSAAVADVALQMSAEIASLQQDVDSPGEYQRLLHSCNGELADLVRQTRDEQQLAKMF